MAVDWLNPYHLQVASFVLINTLLGVSIYVTLSTGQLSLGNAGFMSIGAYATAILTTRHGFPMPAGIAAGPAPAARGGGGRRDPTPLGGCWVLRPPRLLEDRPCVRRRADGREGRRSGGDRHDLLQGPRLHPGGDAVGVRGRPVRPRHVVHQPGRIHEPTGRGDARLRRS